MALTKDHSGSMVVNVAFVVRRASCADVLSTVRAVLPVRAAYFMLIEDGRRGTAWFPWGL